MIHPIGYIESCFKAKFGTPRQGFLAPTSKAIFKLSTQFQSQGLFDGLEDFSHLWLIFLFHANTNRNFHGKIRPPRLQGQSIGVMASRSPHRPNPIGLSLVQLDRVENDTLYLSGIDLIDGTPIIDIKPYVAEADYAENSRGGWIETVSTPPLNVKFRESFLKDLNELKSSGQWQGSDSDLQRLIVESLQNDPRPNVYKRLTAKRPQSIKPHYGYSLYNLDIQFYYEGDVIEVAGVRLASSQVELTESE